MHIMLSTAMDMLGMTDADLMQVIPDPFGNEPFEGDDEIPEDHPDWPAWNAHMECVRKWEQPIKDGHVSDIRFRELCSNAGYKSYHHGSRVMSWFLTEIKDPMQEYVR